MRFDDRYIEELKARLRPSDIIGRSVKLKRQGREFVGLSPFSKEKSPSFFVNDDKGFFHDFSSGKHGDVISFLQETERLSFVEAVSRLAAEAGMALPAEDPQAAEREQKRQGLSDWMDLAQKWFAANLRRSAGKSTREYLQRRGLPEDQWDRFGLGYAPNDRDGVKAALIQRGAKPGELVEAGLLIAPEGGGQPYDRFRDRLMFPILDARGRIVSFGGRAMNPDDRAKYLNGPESPLFHKGATLYGLPEARRILGAESKGEQGIIVVEGYMDVIACQRAGLPAVAPMGTALTEEQMAVLWRVSAEPVLCFDGDAAGRRAMERVIDRALPLLKPDRSFQFVSLPSGADPDDVLRDKGAAALRQAMKGTTPLSAKLFEIEWTRHSPLDTPEKEAGIKAQLRKRAAAIEDKELAQSYKEFLIGAFFEKRRPSRSEVGSAASLMNRARWANRTGHVLGMSPEARVLAAMSIDMPKPFEASIMNGLILFPDIAHDHSESVDLQLFENDDLNRLAHELVGLSINAGYMSADLVRSRLAAVGFDRTLDRVDRSTLRAHAPIQDAVLSADVARSYLLHGLKAQMRLSEFERALAEMKAGERLDSQMFATLKGQRDSLRRHIASGAIWQDEKLAR